MNQQLHNTMEVRNRLEQDLIKGIQVIESKMSYHIGKSSDVKDKESKEMHQDLKSDYELKKFELMKLFIGLTANNGEETREKFKEIMKGIKW